MRLTSICSLTHYTLQIQSPATPDCLSKRQRSTVLSVNPSFQYAVPLAFVNQYVWPFCSRYSYFLFCQKNGWGNSRATKCSEMSDETRKNFTTLLGFNIFYQPSIKIYLSSDYGNNYFLNALLKRKYAKTSALYIYIPTN